MKKQITINITLDTETAFVTDFDITEGTYNRTEFVADGVDNPISVYTTVKWIDRELKNMI